VEFYNLLFGPNPYILTPKHTFNHVRMYFFKRINKIKLGQREKYCDNLAHNYLIGVIEYLYQQSTFSFFETCLERSLWVKCVWLRAILGRVTVRFFFHVCMSKDKVCRKDSYWFVSMIYDSRGLPVVTTVGP
jgi:hypothetical protein